MREKAFGDLVWGILLVLAALFLFWESSHTPQEYEWYRYNNVFWPRIVLAVLLFFSVILVARGLRGMRRVGGKARGEGRAPAQKDESRWVVRFFGIGVFYTLYVVSLPWLGFIVATPPMIFLNMIILGERKLLRIVLTALITNGLFVFLFARIIGIDFPRGVSFFRQLSFIFY